MSALTDLFTALANKIRSKTGGSDTYTPAEMVSDGIDDVYDAGVASVPVTSITPSNATPASISSGTNYNSTANGYAISSYETKTPSNSSTVSLTSGDIYKMGGNGYAIYSYTPKTPSNASPSSVSAAQFYKISKSGYLIQSYSDITPSDSTPVEITSGTIYKASGSGKAVANVTNVTPSTSGASFSAGIAKLATAGYAYSSRPTPTLQTKTAAPNVSTNKTVSPDTGYDGLSQVTITPLSHTGYSPSSSTYTSLAMGESKSIDLGANHDKRYVRVQAAAPSGNKSITANGTGIDVASYSTVSVAVPDPTLSGDAAKENVLSGKTFYNTSTTKQTGTMTNNGAVSKTLSASERSYTVPAGYHNGSGSVTVPAVTATKRVGSTSTSVDVASDDWTVSLNCGDRLYLSKGVIADGYSQGAVAAASLSSQTGVDSGKTAIDASHVHSGYQGWVNGNKISGTYTAPTINNITPDNSTPVSLSSGSIYKMEGNGKAVYSITEVTPSDSSPTHVTESEIIHSSGGGYVIASSPTALAPSDSSPKTISSGTIYKATGNGYAIGSSPASVTPTSSGAAFSAGMVNMSAGGYAYSGKVSPTLIRTTLWTNSSPASSYTGVEITLSQGLSNFDYVEFVWRVSTVSSKEMTMLVPISDFTKYIDDTYNDFVAIGARGSGTTRCYRRIYYVSNTIICIANSYNSSGTTKNDHVIPLYIKGVNLSLSVNTSGT